MTGEISLSTKHRIEKMAWVREILSDEYGVMLAACDIELLDKKLRFGEVEIYISKKFYGEKLVNEEELKFMLETADVLNLVGEKVIKLAEDLGLISPEAKVFFEDSNGKKIPHAQMYRFMVT